MTAEEAYSKIIKGLGLLKVVDCLDFGNFYAFSLAPINTNISDKYCIGTIFKAIYKTTGKIFDYDITSDPEAFLNAKKIKVNTIWNKTLKELN